MSLEDKKDKSAFIVAPELPVIQGPKGIRYDFNAGARVLLPAGKWRVELSEEESGNILFSRDVDSGWVMSTKKYFVPFRIRVWEKVSGQKQAQQQGQEQAQEQDVLLIDHSMDLRGQKVLISFPVGTLGDLLGWAPYAERFRQTYQCEVVCTMGQAIIDLFQPAYPELTFYTPEHYEQQVAARHAPYASYRVGLFFGGNDSDQPIDFRSVGLHRTAGHILGVDPQEIVPALKLDAPRLIKEPYVCIATKGTAQAKFWNNGTGWTEVIRFLKQQGYRVLCIDRDLTVGQGFIWNHMPPGAEDFTGNIELSKRVALLQHADFFIGLGSGLSWLAWACRIPVVLISGFSLPGCEFHTPYRVHNTHVCNGCWDDVRINFDHSDFLWCPRHKGTDRQFECTRYISGRQVIGHVRRVMAAQGRAQIEATIPAAATEQTEQTVEVKEEAVFWMPQGEPAETRATA